MANGSLLLVPKKENGSAIISCNGDRLPCLPVQNEHAAARSLLDEMGLITAIVANLYVVQWMFSFRVEISIRLDHGGLIDGRARATPALDLNRDRLAVSQKDMQPFTASPH